MPSIRFVLMVLAMTVLTAAMAVFAYADSHFGDGTLQTRYPTAADRPLDASADEFVEP